MRDEGLSQDLSHPEDLLLLLEFVALFADCPLLLSLEIFPQIFELFTCFLFERGLFIVLI